MYERGVADAAQGEPHPFYYQHYYYYRRGYDQARRRLGRPAVRIGQRRVPLRWLLVLAIVIAGGASYWLLLRPPPPQAAGQGPAEVAAAPTATARPVRTQIFPTATPTPTLTPTPAPALRVGGGAVVSIAGLRARREPSLKAQITARFREGERVTILDGPREADGYVWWQLEGASGAGWSAERSPEGVVWIQPAEG